MPHTEYAVYTVSQDRIVYRLRLHNDPNKPIEVRIVNDQTKKDHNWNPISRDQVSDELAQLVPSSHGQIKLFVIPIRLPRTESSPHAVFRGGDYGATRGLTLFSPTRSAGSISSVVLQTGSAAKASGSLYTGDLIVPSNVDAIVYNIRPIALTPTRIERLQPGELVQALQTIPNSVGVN